MSLEDRSWMYSGWSSNGCHTQEWVRNTDGFLDRAFEGIPNSDRFGVVCPCSDCHNRIRRKRHVMSVHLCQKGYMTGYTRWTEHGERPIMPSIVQDTYNTADGLDDMLGNFGDAMHSDITEEEPTPDAKAFYAMLSASQEPLHNYTQVSRLTTVARLMGIKSQHNISAECMDNLLKLIGDILPDGHKLPSNLYECMRILSGLKMPSVKLDCCIKNCMIYYKEHEHKEKCDFCGESRYVVSKSEIQGRKRKPVPRKVLRYLPIVPRLQRLFMHPETAKHMRYHKDGHRENPKLMVHPSDGEAWKHFDTFFPNFALESRNVRVVIATDGFNPFGFGASPYSCWPVFVVPLNLPPALCMKEENIFLSLVIPGPNHPGKNLNAFMRPLFDELDQAWEVGVNTYDSFSKQNFNMRVSYFTSVHDYPALGMFSSWSTHGGLACHICMADINTIWLPKGHKWSYFDYHRRLLPLDHPFRSQRNAFRKGVEVHDLSPRQLTGEEVLAYMKDVESKNFEGYGETHNWTHIPIWWELSYFRKLLILHAIDIMHTEKNCGEASYNTCLNIPEKTKDNPRARLDQALICNRPHLNLVEKPNGGWDSPKAPFALTRPQKKEVMKWFMDIKFPDGYAANLRRGVNMEQLKIHGLKSHDYHIFIERLLPVMMRGFVKNEVWEVLAELSYFFRVLCAKEVDPDQMLQLEENVGVLVCKLEKM